MNRILSARRHSVSIFLTLALGIASLSGVAPLRAADSVGEKVGAAAVDAEKQVQDASQATETKLQELWRRIDEQRLKNRTPDQIVAWIIVGLLVGGLINQLSKLNKVANFLLGLVGAFVGGVVANVAQINLGLGPVLIRYEDLIASLLGGLLILGAVLWLGSRRAKKK
jgi:uncharacterized membrane protein YeaQ/YmgE (transglycosylase-associated protein family)